MPVALNLFTCKFQKTSLAICKSTRYLVSRVHHPPLQVSENMEHKTYKLQKYDKAYQSISV